MKVATTAGTFKSHKHTNLDSGTTATSFPEGTEVHHVATEEDVFPNNATVATGTTAAHNRSRTDSLTTVTSPSNPAYVSATTESYKSENSVTADDNRNHHNRTNMSLSGAEGSTTTGTPPSNNTTPFNINTDTDNDGTAPNTATTGSTNTAVNHTTESYNYTTQHNTTDSLKTHANTASPYTPDYNTTGDNNFTPDHNHTAKAANMYATASHKYTTEVNHTADDNATDTFRPSNNYTNINNITTVSAPSIETTVPPNQTVTGSFTTPAFKEMQQVVISTTASGASTLGNATTVTQTSAESTVPLLPTLTTPVTRNVTSPNHVTSYTPANMAETVGSGSSAANASQTTTKDPGVTSPVGLLATAASIPHSSQASITMATLPLTPPTTTVSSATNPGTYRSQPLDISRRLRNLQKNP